MGVFVDCCLPCFLQASALSSISDSEVTPPPPPPRMKSEMSALQGVGRERSHRSSHVLKHGAGPAQHELPSGVQSRAPSMQ